MIKLYSLLLTVTITTLSVFAQPPHKMSYQAVIRDSEGRLVVSRDIGMRISILQGSAGGTAVYTETRTPVYKCKRAGNFRDWWQRDKFCNGCFFGYRLVRWPLFY
jgi:hypothetical protein